MLVNNDTFANFVSTQTIINIMCLSHIRYKPYCARSHELKINFKFGEGIVKTTH